jgi:hypothetical protein
MARGSSLSDYYNTLDAFQDSDRLIRIAAIHHAKSSLRRSEKLKSIVEDLLNDTDSLVSQYAAVTLAQSGDEVGLKHLLRLIASSRGQEREDLSKCLRNCSEFPFAVLLDELIYVESVDHAQEEPHRDFLKEALGLTAERFYNRVEEDAGFRKDFFQIMKDLDSIHGLRTKPGKHMAIGRILLCPMGKQPGFIHAAGNYSFFKFQEDAVLNREYVENGREVLLIHNTRDASNQVNTIYVLEDSPAKRVQLSKDDIMFSVGKSPLLAGIVVAKTRREKESAEVWTPDGKSLFEFYRVQKAQAGQFALIEQETELGRPQCHFIVGLRPDSLAIEAIVAHFASATRRTVARIIQVTPDVHPKSGLNRCIACTDGGKAVTTYVPSPRKDGRILMRDCDKCGGSGKVGCELCASTGHETCSNCSGTGEKGCDWCHGSGKCSKCSGSGAFGGGDCWNCDGGGLCKKCHGTGHISCWVCKGDGGRDCPRCKGNGVSTCGYCGGDGLIFSARIDC